MAKKLWRVILVGGLLPAIFWAGVSVDGCKKVNDPSAQKDIYNGRFIFERDPYTVGGVDTDLVKFTIEQGRYSIRFSTFNSRLCDSKGVAYGFGGNTVDLYPDSFLTTNCDSIHVPKGVFTSYFNGDSLYLAKHDTATDDWYRFQLKQ